MGAAADVAGQFGGILVMAIGCLYVLVVGFAYRVLESGKETRGSLIGSRHFGAD